MDTPEPPVARGSNNPNTAAAAQQGRAAHKQARVADSSGKNFYDVPYNDTERTIKFTDSKGNAAAGKADAVDFKKHIVYELKPNNPKAIAKGQKQLADYINGLTDEGKGVFTGKIVVYDVVDGIFKYTIL